jgi:vacuolar-type H+-ATPase subunit E/Vma4
VPLPDQVSLLCREIQKKGQAAAEKILSRAEEQAKRIVRDAEEKMHNELEDRLSQKRQSAFLQARQLKDGATLQAEKQLLLARESLIQELLQETRQRLITLRDGAEYPAVLQSLIVQALTEIPGEQCWIQVRKQDQSLFSDEFLRTLMEHDRRRLELMTEPAAISGGCLVYSFDRKMLVDFSFSVLLTRAQPKLRELMAAELLEKEE